MVTKIKIVFNQLGRYQLPDCLFCGKQATQQADTPKIGGYAASIRTCSDSNCMDLARKMAEDCMNRSRQ